MVLQKDSEKFVLVDVNALVHRAYHAYPDTLSVDGMPTNAIYGFTILLLEVLEKFSPKYVICSIDVGKAEKRLEIYKEYKATRKPMEDNLRKQLPVVHEIIKSLGIPIYSKKGYEADDVIGTIVNMKNIEGREGLETIIVTGDKDIFQLVDEDTYVYLAGSSFSKSKLYGIKEVKEKMGFGPEYIVDYKALRGDPSDNIPGVSGIGDKSAIQLIKEYGHVDNIFKNVGYINSTRIKNALGGKKEEAELSRELATIETEIPVDFDLGDESVLFEGLNQEAFIEICERYRFNTILRRYKLERLEEKEKEEDKVQLGMFGNEGKEDPIKKLDYLIVNNTNKQEFLSSFAGHSDFAFDTETDSLDVFTANLIGLSIAFDEGQSFYIPQELLKDKVFIKELKKFFEDESYKKIAHNLKFDQQALRLIGIELRGETFDTMLAAYVLQMGEGLVGLKELATKHFGLELKSFNELLKLAEIKGKPDTIPVEDIAEYCCYDSRISYDLYSIFSKMLSLEENRGILKILNRIELPLVDVLDRMESTGIKLDIEYLQNFAKELDRSIEELQTKIYKLADMNFNLNSPKQLGEVLFDKLGLTGTKKTSTGAYSTNERVLREIIGQHEIVGLILEYRELAKLRSTYTDTLVAKVNSDTGRVHTTFNQAVASTGRLSSSEPNLQNIPVSSEVGRKIRNAFIAEKGKVFVSLDYSQQELRILAAVSRDKELMRSYEQGVDVHALTASRLFGVDINKVTKDQRSQGKTVNFSVIYGISAFGLADRLKIPRDMAQQFIDKYFEVYPGVDRYFKGLLDRARMKGYVQTLYGRRRTSEGLMSRNFRVRSAVEREIINFPIQGGAADMMKLAMIKVDELLNKKDWKDYRMLVQVHDELLFEAPVAEDKISDWSAYLEKDTKLKKLIDKVREIMLDVNLYDVPMAVDVGVGRRWGEVEEIPV